MATIIIIDDSAAVRDQLREALQKGGHQVIEAVDGNDGLSKIMATKTPNLVISDYNMPGLDGIAMLTKAKEQLGSYKFPIFMLTTETSEKLQAVGKEAGVIAWINKPFDGDKLLAAVNKITSKT